MIEYIIIIAAFQTHYNINKIKINVKCKKTEILLGDHTDKQYMYSGMK